MKKLAQIIDELIKLNINIQAQGNDLRIWGSEENITPEIIRKIKENKDSLLIYLRSATAADHLNNGYT